MTDRCGAPPTRIAPRRAWLLLGVAVLGEIGGVLGLRYSEGFTAPLPTMAALAAFGVALFLVSRVMRELPVSIAYPLWAGGGTAGVAALGMTALGEPATALRLAGIVCVLVGVVLVNSSGEKRSGC
jgi:small multidrug resistance pump